MANCLTNTKNTPLPATSPSPRRRPKARRSRLSLTDHVSVLLEILVDVIPVNLWAQAAGVHPTVGRGRVAGHPDVHAPLVYARLAVLSRQATRVARQATGG